MRILLVEDDNGVRNILAKFLVEEKHAVKLAVNGREGLELLEEFEPELVLSDIKMPELNGLEFLETVRASSSVPFVMVTGYADTDVAVRALRAGAWYFILKPVNFFELKSILDRVQERLELERALTAERARSLDYYNREELTAMLSGIAGEAAEPLQKIRRSLGPLQKSLVRLNNGLSELPDSGAGVRMLLKDSLECFAKLDLDFQDGRFCFESLDSVVDILAQSQAEAASSREEFPLDEALRSAFCLLDSPPETHVFVSIEHDIVLYADRERFVRTVARLMRAALGQELTGPVKSLDISAHRENGDLCLLVAGTSSQQAARSRLSSADDPSGAAENAPETLDFMVLSGAVKALGGRLKRRCPDSGGTIFTLHMSLPPVDASGACRSLAARGHEDCMRVTRRISGDRF